jgi:hypothetical protein
MARALLDAAAFAFTAHPWAATFAYASGASAAVREGGLRAVVAANSFARQWSVHLAWPVQYQRAAD